MHCHTNRSDGSDSPEFVIRLARQIGLTALAITDHDYYSGAYDAHKLGESMGIRVINGVECSTFDYNHGNKVHILCYQVKRPDAIEELLSRETAARTEATLAMVNKATKIYPITEEMVTDGVSESGFIGKQHIMLYEANRLLEDGWHRSVMMQSITWDKNGLPVFGKPVIE